MTDVQHWMPHGSISFEWGVTGHGGGVLNILKMRRDDGQTIYETVVDSRESFDEALRFHVSDLREAFSKYCEQIAAHEAAKKAA